jgi:hypothetical protein
VLCGADIRAVDLVEANLQGALADDSTKWPEGFDPAAHGVIVHGRDA